MNILFILSDVSDNQICIRKFATIEDVPEELKKALLRSQACEFDSNHTYALGDGGGDQDLFDAIIAASGMGEPMKLPCEVTYTAEAFAV